MSPLLLVPNTVSQGNGGPKLVTNVVRLSKTLAAIFII